MGQRIRSPAARYLAVLVAPLLVLGMMAGMAPASAASPLSHESGGRIAADPTALAASLQAAIGASPGTSVSAAGYSRRAELTASNGPRATSSASRWLCPPRAPRPWSGRRGAT